MIDRDLRRKYSKDAPKKIRVTAQRELDGVHELFLSKDSRRIGT